MKIIVKENSVIVVGKAWQVQAALRKYIKHFDTIEEWVKAVNTV